MTYKELYLKEHPECEDFPEVVSADCPGDHFNNEEAPHPCEQTCSLWPQCKECWDQEIPEEKTTVFEQVELTKDDIIIGPGDPEFEKAEKAMSDVISGFKAKDFIPVGEEVAKGFEKSILEPKTSVNFDGAELQKKVYEALGIPEFKPLTGEEIREYANELYEEYLKKHGDKFKDAADTRMMLEKENLEEIDNDILKEMIKSTEKEASSIKDIEVKPEVDIDDMRVESTDHGMSIKDSGTRREFATGAVRDIQDGKGRCDLMPLDVIADLLRDNVLSDIDEFQKSGDYAWLNRILCITCQQEVYRNEYTMLLEVAKHFEAGAAKYGEWNWQKGIPTHCYIDSAVRHYLKFLRGDKDEPHDRAFVWNILCCIWTCKHKPELNDYPRKEKTDE